TKVRRVSFGVLGMKQLEYVEGIKATENFEQGMKALFNVPKAAVVKAEKQKQKAARASRLRKLKLSDKD
ncbi:MAG: hypothetical protein WAK89_00935, partial [Candidatus Sulfotelmatobacter sp.]